MIGVLLSHETRIHNVIIETVTIMIDVSHETRVHNIALECVIIKINMLSGEMKSNEKIA